jgi:hypothetical protein
MQQTHPLQSVSPDRVDSERVARLERAGVRRIRCDAAPTSTFVAVETAVLVMVAALAMTSIIVTANEPDGESAGTQTAVATRQVVAATSNDGARRDALFVGR